MPIDLPHITGKVPYDVEQAILRLREAIEGVQGQQQILAEGLASMPPPLTLPEVQQALSPAGAYPLITASVIGPTLPTAQTSPVPAPSPVPGQQTFTAWGAICRDGTHVTTVASQTGLTPTLQFGSDTPITLPEYGTFLAAVSGGFGHLAIVKGANTGQAILVNRTGAITLLGVAYGNYSVALRDDGSAVWQEDANNYNAGGVSTAIPPAYVGTTNGFLQLDPAGDPVWTDEQLATPVVIDGVTFLLSTTDGTWTVGMSALGPYFIAYDSGTTTMFVIGPTQGTTIALRLAQQPDGSAIVASSLPAVWTASAAFTTYNIPEAPGTDAIDITTVTFVQSAPVPDPTTWPKGTTLNSPAHLGTDVSTPYDQSLYWPGVGPGNAYQGQQWLFAFIGGQWYAGAAAILPVGTVFQTYNDATLGATYFAGTFLETWVPAPLDSVGVMVTPPARFGQWGAAVRSNIALITW